MSLFARVRHFFRRSRGINPGTARWTGAHGFYAMKAKLLSRGLSEESANAIAGAAKGKAKRMGVLRKIHSYSPNERRRAKLHLAKRQR